MPHKYIGNPVTDSVLVGLNRRRDGGSTRTFMKQGLISTIGSLVGPSLTSQNVAEINYQRGENIATLTTTIDDPYPGSMQATTTVSLRVNRVQKAIMEPPLPGSASMLESKDLIEIKAALNEKPKPRPIDQSQLYDSDPARLSTANAVYSLLLKGVETRVVFQPVLTLKMLATNIYTWSNSFANVGSIIHPGSITRELPVSLALRFGLPTVPPSAQIPSGYSYGWLKNMAEIEQGAENIETLSQEYEYGLWPEVLWGSPVVL